MSHELLSYIDTSNYQQGGVEQKASSVMAMSPVAFSCSYQILLDKLFGIFFFCAASTKNTNQIY